jgi:hypothetical protein
MSTTRKAIALAVMLTQVAACAGRDAAPAQPVAMPTDQQLDCPALFAEITGNNAKVVSLSSEESNKRGQNIAMGVVGAIIFWPALLAMDFKDAAGTDRKAVEARLAYLNSLYGAKHCAGVTGAAPAVPAPVPTPTPEIKSPADNR